MREFAGLCLIGLVAIARPASALEPTLSPAAVNDALDAGHRMAGARGGYDIAPYLLFTVPDAVLIAADDPGIEAVQLGTPFERLRFEAYREAAMRTPFNTSDVATFDDQHAGRVDFIVYAHSRDDKDRAFLGRFGGGTLLRTDGTPVASAQLSRTVPVPDTYTERGGGVVTRYLGQVTYRFTIAGDSTATAALAAPLTFAFTDDRGADHRIPVTLANFR